MWSHEERQCPALPVPGTSFAFDQLFKYSLYISMTVALFEGMCIVEDSMCIMSMQTCFFFVKRAEIARFLWLLFLAVLCWCGLGWRKEWICSERPITVCPLVTCWTHARCTRYGITARSRGNKDQSGVLHRLHYWETLSPPPAGGGKSINSGLLAAISRHWLRLACSGWPAGFESTCVWSSKMWWIVRVVGSGAKQCIILSAREIGLNYILQCYPSMLLYCITGIFTGIKFSLFSCCQR